MGVSLVVVHEDLSLLEANTEPKSNPIRLDDPVSKRQSQPQIAAAVFLILYMVAGRPF